MHPIEDQPGPASAEHPPPSEGPEPAVRALQTRFDCLLVAFPHAVCSLDIDLVQRSIRIRAARAVLSPYKYAGYPMLIGTLKLETADAQLFSKETPLLPAAAQLAYHTIDCSALNAEELRRYVVRVECEYLSQLRCIHTYSKSIHPCAPPQYENENVCVSLFAWRCRELGIEVLQDAFARCVAVLTSSSRPTDLAAQVCSALLLLISLCSF